MMNGRPTLTFGDNNYSAPSQIQLRAGNKNLRNNPRVAGDFESYLPAPEVVQTNMAAQKGGKMPQMPLSQNGLGLLSQPGMPSGETSQLSYPGAGLPSGNIGAYQSMLQSPSRPLHQSLPLDGNSRAQARKESLANMEALRGGNLGQTPVRQSAKSRPRVSGQPITGRNDFGMVDTRKSISLLSGKSSTRAVQPYGMNTQGYGQNFDGVGQSFVTHGFSGGNAEFALRSLGYDINETQPGVTFAKRLDSDSGVAVRSGLGSHQFGGLGAGEDSALASAFTPGNRQKASSPVDRAYPARSLVHSFYGMANSGLGSLAAKFESGEEGIAAIGFDRKGGTSYGKYQISSRAGTMSAFIEYLEEHAPDVAKRLQAAGPANTGGRSGKMPTEWRKLASEDPGRFEKLQSEFIRTSHFEPAMESIAASTGVGFSKMPDALQEVLFSTAVQHGPFGAARIFNQALNSVDIKKLQMTGSNITESFKKAGRQLIKQVYALRAGQFVSSTASVRAAVKNRLTQEMHDALQMLS